MCYLYALPLPFSVYVVCSRRAVGRVPISEQPAAEADDDDQYEDMENEGDTAAQPLTHDTLTDGNGGGGDLSMIMEQSYMDQDFNLCLSGIFQFTVTGKMKAV